jgi:hypothetical protein
MGHGPPGISFMPELFAVLRTVRVTLRVEQTHDTSLARLRLFPKNE